MDRSKHRALPVFHALLCTCTFIASPAAHGQNPQAFGSGIDICVPPVQPVSLVDPTVITDCTESGIQVSLDGGGPIAFDCGSGPVTIPLSSTLELSTSTDTTLDGGGLVTLDGQGLVRILHKEWHDPDTVGDITITLQNLRFIRGKAPGGGNPIDHSGGAIAAGHPGTRLRIIDCTFGNNTTTDVFVEDNQGGAIFAHNAYETVIAGSVFTTNSAGNGGAFGGIATGLLVFNSRFEGNHGLDNGPGGIVRGYGGAIYLDGVKNGYNPDSNKQVHVCGCVFEDNTAVRGGGAVAVIVSDNYGIKATYERSDFTNNEVLGRDNRSGQGGAIYHIEDDHAGGTGEDNFEVGQTTFHGNKARFQGGALWVYILGYGRVVNTTFQGNTTTAPFNEVGQGGAMMGMLGTLDLLNVTFANNHAAYQGGAIHGGSSSNPITLTNTIFYDNTLNIQDLPTSTRWQGFHTDRPMIDGGQNMQFPRYKPVYDNEFSNNITANPIYEDPLLLPLADNGGPTRTMALQRGSPAIDAGAQGCLPGDQRGVLREGPCDIGAYEYQAGRLIITPLVKIASPGESAIYHVQVETASGFTGDINLSAVNPYGTLIADLSPTTVQPLEIATLTLTDTHTDPVLLPGLYHTVTVTADGDGLSLSADAILLVGGARVYLPMVVQVRGGAASAAGRRARSVAGFHSYDRSTRHRDEQTRRQSR